MEIKEASQNVLDKYGLTLAEWKDIWNRQGKKCPICKKEPKTGTPIEFNVDHAHVKGWKKLPPEERKLYVRGIVCNWCNRSYISKAISVIKAKNIIEYLTDFENRRK